MKQNPDFTREEARTAYDVLMRIAEDCTDRCAQIVCREYMDGISDYMDFQRMGEQMERTALMLEPIWRTPQC